MNKKSKQHLERLKQESKDLRDKNGKPIDIPQKGSLGVLALGAKGIMAWREKKATSR